MWHDANEANNWPALIELPGGPIAPVTYTSRTLTTPPPPLANHAVAPLPNGGALLFGGSTSSTPQPYTYTLANNAWTLQFPPFSPVPREDHVLTLDPVRNNNVLFGGKNPLGTPLGDTWIWANGRWTYQWQLTNAPSPRSGHRMTWDGVAGVGLLFGGEDGLGVPQGDFWSWNGTTWGALTPALLPPARARHGLAYDALRNKTVLFGGRQGQTKRSDVWEWDGTAWTDATPATTPYPFGPGPVEGHSMAYDPLAERVLVVGGNGATGCSADAWTWNGTGWTLHLSPTATTTPAARSGAQLVPDGATRRLMLVGGSCGSGASGTYYNDAWSYELPVYTRTATYGAGCPGSLGVPTLAVASGSKPLIGQSFQLEIGNIPGSPFNTPFGVFDLQRNNFRGVPIPFDLSILGLPGCAAWTGGSWSVVLTPAGTNPTAPWTIALPNIPLFLGEFLYCQAAIFDFANGRFASLTNGVEARLGNR